MSGGGRISVLLAGPYPHPGGMTGTYGRILNNLRMSPVFEKDVDFIPHRVTLPADGGFVKREIIDLARGARSLIRRPDVLHFILAKFRSLYREYPILHAAKRTGVKTLVDIRAGSLQPMLERRGYRLQNGLMRSLLRAADAVVLECWKDVTFLQDQFEREGLYLPNVALASDFDRVKPSSDAPGDGRPIRLIHSGRYAHFKGTGVLLETMKILSERGLKAELHLTGQGSDPDLLREIRAYADDPPAGIRIVDHGWDVPDLYGLMASGHVFVMLTDWRGEGHPNVVTEAMMAGLAMILSDWRHREDVVPDEGAIIVPSTDHGALAAAIERFATEPGLLARAREVNRRRVKEHYLDSICYPRLLQLYKQLCSRP